MGSVVLNKIIFKKKKRKKSGYEKLESMGKAGVSYHHTKKSYLKLIGSVRRN